MIDRDIKRVDAKLKHRERRNLELALQIAENDREIKGLRRQIGQINVEMSIEGVLPRIGELRIEPR